MRCFFLCIGPHETCGAWYSQIFNNLLRHSDHTVEAQAKKARSREGTGSCCPSLRSVQGAAFWKGDLMFDLEDYVETETAVAIAATALILSPRARRVVRRGVVYGLAGILTAVEAGRSLLQGARAGFTAAVTRARPASQINLN